MSRQQARGALGRAWWLQLALALLPADPGRVLPRRTATPSPWPGDAAVHRRAAVDVRQPAAVRCLQAWSHRHPESAGYGGGSRRLARLAQVRRKALFGASLPAWIGVPGVFAGLNGVALILLGVTSLVLFWLYRIPRQLG